MDKGRLRKCSSFLSKPAANQKRYTQTISSSELLSFLRVFVCFV